VKADKPLAAKHGLNGDTAVVSALQLKRSFRKIRGEHARFDKDYSRLKVPALVDTETAPCYFNITEDWNIDTYTCTEDEGRDDNEEGGSTERHAKRPTSEAMLELLWNPLPFDLPWGDKDLLILMAAYHGDVDRYARLRRPQHVSWPSATASHAASTTARLLRGGAPSTCPTPTPISPSTTKAPSRRVSS
jgi:hypothetical protein